MRRTKKEMARWDNRPTRELMSPISLRKGLPEEQLAERLRRAAGQQASRKDPLHAARSGIKHYLRFCERIGEENNISPPIKEMVERVTMWLQDAPLEYTYKGRKKRLLAASSMFQYLRNIDTWWSITMGNPKCLLSKQTEVITRRQEVTAAAKSAQRQVHGLSAKHIHRMHRKASRYQTGPTEMLRSAHTLAWFAMLQPTEYMPTPAHKLFDRTRHLRAGDVQLFKVSKRLKATSNQTATHMTVNVKQSKTDHQRMGAGLTLGATSDRATCPVRSMQHYPRTRKSPPEGPLYPGLQYTRMLKKNEGARQKTPGTLRPTHLQSRWSPGTGPSSTLVRVHRG